MLLVLTAVDLTVVGLTDDGYRRYVLSVLLYKPVFLVRSASAAMGTGAATTGAGTGRWSCW
jgi:hypothetical protein